MATQGSVDYSNSIYDYDKGTEKSEINPNLMLGNLYKSYLNSLQTRALTTPSEYAMVRGKLETEIKNTIIASFYKDIRAILTRGVAKAGGNDYLIVFDGKALAPNISPNSVNNICMGFAETLNDFLDEVIEKICPSFNEILSSRLRAKGSETIN